MFCANYRTIGNASTRLVPPRNIACASFSPLVHPFEGDRQNFRRRYRRSRDCDNFCSLSVTAPEIEFPVSLFRVFANDALASAVHSDCSRASFFSLSRGYRLDRVPEEHERATRSAAGGVTIIQIPPILLFALRILPFGRGAPMGVAQPWPHYQSKYFIVEPPVTTTREGGSGKKLERRCRRIVVEM